MRKKPCLQASDVRKMAEACRAEAEKNKWVVTVAITDDAGVLRSSDGGQTFDHANNGFIHRSIAALAVPPVAIRSSISSTRSPGLMASA